MWRPGDDGPDREAEFGTLVYANKHRNLPLSRQRQLLPIARYRDSLLYALEEYRTVVVVGETGCGKTTQLPQYLHEAGWTAGGRRVVCTQPRRVAAVTVAQRVADEMGRELGGTVGYAVRFDDRTGEDTAIKFCTDGLLIREALRDPLLSRVSVVIVDEAHERSLHTDVLLGLLKKVQRRRKDLRIIVASATLDAEKFRDFFEAAGRKKAKKGKATDAGGERTSAKEGGEARKGGPSTSGAHTSDPAPETARHRALAALDAAMGSTGASRGPEKSEEPEASEEKPTATIVSVSGRTHPVEVCFAAKPQKDYIAAAVDTVVAIHRQEGEGDILVFLPGMQEVDAAVRMIKDTDVDSRTLWVLPLYAALPSHEQMRVFDRSRQRGMRKVVCATTIAETSVTIDGICFVVDAGFHKLPYFNPSTGIESLLTAPISRASAVQRAGRAGRTQPGKCFRLYTEAAFQNETVMPAATPPEMQRVSLTWAVLQLKALGIDDVLHFDFVSPPSAETMLHALEMLYSLGALDDHCRITSPVGVQLAEFPLEPRLAKALLSSWDFGCGEEMIVVAAMLSVGEVWIHPRGSRGQRDKLDVAMAEFAVGEGDHVTLLNVFRGFEDEPEGNNQSPQEWCAENMLNHRALKRAKEVHRQLKGYLLRTARELHSGESRPLASCGDDTTAILKCIISGFFANVARLGPDGLYRTIRGSRRVQLYPNSILAKYGAPPEFVVFDQYLSLSQDFLRGCSKIHPRWLLELAPHFYESTDARGRSFIRPAEPGPGRRGFGASDLGDTLGEATQHSAATKAAKRIFDREDSGTSLLASALMNTTGGSSGGGSGGGGGGSGSGGGSTSTAAKSSGSKRKRGSGSGGSGGGGITRR